MSDKRVGIAVLSSDVVLEREIRSVMPHEIATYISRVAYPEGVSATSLASAVRQIDRAVRLLAPTRPDVVVWACTSGSFFRGAGFNVQLTSRLSRVAGVPAFTASTAVVQSLRALGARRISVVTPYSSEINDRLLEFLAEEGIAVSATTQLFGDHPLSDLDLQSAPRSEVRSACLSAARTGDDALLVCCTGIALAEDVCTLESHLNMPVVSSNLAIMSRVLDYCGFAGQITGFGHLLSSVGVRDD